MESEAKRQLGRMARTLEAMNRDAVALLASMSEATANRIAAFHTLGPENNEVSRASFGEHFLSLWLDWSGLLGRWQRYCGIVENRTSAAWQRLADRTNESAERLLSNGEWQAELLTAWTAERLEGSARDAFSSPHAAYRAVVEADSRGRLAQNMLGTHSAGLRALASHHLEATVMAVVHSQPEIRDWTFEYLRRYRHALLRLPWLQFGRDEGGGWRYLWRDAVETRWTSSAMESLKLEDDVVHTVHRILERLATTIAELGYDAFVDDITADDFQGGSDSPLGAGNINLIPSKHKGACCTVLVSVSQGAGRRRGLSFSAIMERTKAHLYACKGITKLVVFLCDQWDSRTFQQEHADFLRACYREGVRFLFLLVGPDGRNISPVTVNLT